MSSVLVVDDAETTRKFFLQTLQDDYDLTLCENWSEASNELDDQVFDLIYLDCWLPDKEGIAVLETLRESYEGPVVLMSGYADETIVNKAHSLGINRFLEKPFEPETIRKTTRDLLEERTQDDTSATEPRELPDDLDFHEELRILVVDDEESTRELLSHPLEHYELEYRMTGDGREAWSLVQEFDPNVVILDARLEGSPLSSPELLQKIRTRDRETFIIGITGYPESQEFEQFNRDEITEFYYKPFPINELLRNLSYLSFVIHKRQNDPTESRKSDNEEKVGSRYSGIKQKIAIGLIALLVGLSLGFLIKWTRNLARSSSEDALNIKKMFRSIEGYLQRDERRERREMN